MAFDAESSRAQVDAASQSEDRPSAQPSSAAMLAVQLGVTFVLVACCAACAAWGLPVIVVAVFAALSVLTFVALWPLRADAIARIAALAAGVVSIIIAVLPVPAGSDGVRVAVSSLATAVVARWSSALLVLLVLLVVTGFLRQMLREPRTQMVRSLSSYVLGGVVALGAGGWVVLARVLYVMHDATEARSAKGSWFVSAASPWGAIAVLIAAGALIAAIALASRQWRRQWATAAARPRQDSASALWLGFGLLPALLYGLIAFLVAFVALVL
jgi:hypothetical protein